MLDIAIILAATGITVLEMAEASAVGITLYAGTKQSSIFAYLAAGVFVIFLPTAIIGGLIDLIPITYVRLISATLLLYFGVRLLRSAARSFMFQKIGFPGGESMVEKGVGFTAFSVGAVEAFEAAIVLVALYPNGYVSTLLGIVAGVLLVIGFSIVLQTQIRKVKQALMKAMVSAILLTFSAFWYSETIYAMNDLLLIPLFIGFLIVVYYLANAWAGKMEKSRHPA